MFSPAVLRHAPWSISKVGVLERCGLQYKFKHVDKLPDQSSSKQSRIGVAVHSVIETVLKGNDPADGAPDSDALLAKVAEEQKLSSEEVDAAKSFLPAVDDFLTRIRAFCRDQGVTQILVEHRLALKPDFTATTFWDKGAILRGVVDLGLVTKNGVLVVIDHKTGKPKPIGEHMTQFYAYMLMGAAHYDVTHVQCAIHYVGNPKLDWAPAFSRAEIERKARAWLVAYLNKLEQKIAVVEGGSPSAETGWQCEYCSHNTICELGAAEVAKRKAKRSGQVPNV